MELIKTIAEMQRVSASFPAHQKIGFVPTMGYLHAGHLSLVEQSNRQCDITVVSIYVNPAQFSPTEDLSSYPRDLEHDLELLTQYKVDYVFFPTNAEMYPAGYKTWVEVEEISNILCGASRPGHFRGVATIVLKLVNIVKPHLMFMGEKDFQQVTVLKTLLTDLNLKTQIVSCPIVREKNGLAMSSRNVYLNPQERQQARCLSETIRKIQSLYKAGITDSAQLIEAGRKHIRERGGKLDYLSLVDSETLEMMLVSNSRTRIILAVFIGKTRLIDNQALVSR